ncbi:hypothetical protein RHGRI_015847 [Rhododendron griersonianum]|uniref:Uncharacterized protein n=1 Tax=Rhododendron griersonianum TaxID=479676 RepID=A0AAV6JNZ0_9ERIC|nr:hypothetical protein RHGRI_015847 [Rhododendron griersonianum]
MRPMMKFRGDVLFLSFIWVNVWVGSLRKQIYMRPVETGSPQQIGVLATDATLKADFYQEKLCSEPPSPIMNHFNFTGNNFDFLYKQDFEVVLPGKPTIEHTVIPAIEALNRKDMEGARNLLRIAP